MNLCLEIDEERVVKDKEGDCLWDCMGLDENWSLEAVRWAWVRLIRMYRVELVKINEMTVKGVGESGADRWKS